MDDYLVYSILIISAVLILFIGIILILRLNYVRQERLYARLSSQWTSLLYEYLDDEIDIDEIVPVMRKKKHFDFLWRFLTPYLKNFRGEEVEKINYLAQECGLDNYFINKVKHSHNKWEQAYGINALAMLHHEETVLLAKPLLRSKVPQVVFAAARSIALTGISEHFYPVLQAIFKNTYITNEGAVEIVTSFGEDICPEVINILEDTAAVRNNAGHSEKVQMEYMYIIAMIDFLGYFSFLQAQPVLEKLLKEESDTEIIIHLVKALARMDLPVGSTDLHPFLNHENAVIRSQAAHLAGQTGDEKYFAKLKELLNDTNWWVRYHAARGLYKMNVSGRDYLMNIAESNEGKAASIAAWVCAEMQ